MSAYTILLFAYFYYLLLFDLLFYITHNNIIYIQKIIFKMIILIFFKYLCDFLIRVISA